jgi:hypothetical protein
MDPHVSSKRDRGKPPPTPLEKSRRAALATYPVRDPGADPGLEYVLLADRIEGWRGEQVVATHPLADIRRVRLGFDPGEPRAFYTCTITAAAFEIVLRYSSVNTRADGSFSHFGSSARYDDFVRKLLGQLAGRPGVRLPRDRAGPGRGGDRDRRLLDVPGLLASRLRSAESARKGAARLEGAAPVTGWARM